MDSRHTTRKALSLMLALAILCWADTSLAMLPMSAHGAQCLSGMLAPQRAAPYSAMQPATPACHHHHAMSAPSAPTVDTLLAFQCEDQHGCCKLSRPGARPSEFVMISGKSRSMVLKAGGTGAEELVALPQRSAFLSIGNSPPAVRAVLDQKADLRI